MTLKGVQTGKQLNWRIVLFFFLGASILVMLLTGEKGFARDSTFTQKGTGPLYWTSYEYQQSNNTWLDENVWKTNIDWLSSSGLAASGYNMAVTDGWVEGSQRVNANGYIISHNDNWLHDWTYWANYLTGKGMKLGIYYDPMWITANAYSLNLPVIGTSYHIQDITGSVSYNSSLKWVDTDKPGAMEFIKGYVNYFISTGAKYLRIDFLRDYENNYGTARYVKAIQWIKEAAGNAIEVSLVMPNLYNHGANELLYGDMVRIDDDALLKGWPHISGDRRGSSQSYWSQYGNAFDGFVGFSDIAGTSSTGNNKLILDGDFLRMNAYANDTERKFALTAFAVAGSPLSFVDQYNTIGANASILQNSEVIGLNTAGFVGRPQVIDFLNGKSQIWKGQLSTGEWIVALFNRETYSLARSIDFAKDLGISGSATVHDMWSHTDLGSMTGYAVNLTSHDVRLLKISGTTAASNYIQAEYGMMLGNAHVYVDKDGAYNTNGVGYLGAAGDGVQFSNVAAGSTLGIRYANGNGANAQLDLYINGVFNQTVNFPATSGWTGLNAYQKLSITASIPNGATVKLVKNASAAVNLDYITTGAGGPAAVTTGEAENGELLGLYVDTYWDAAAGNSQGVGYLGGVGTGVQWRNAAAASSVTIRYAAVSNGQAGLYINGVRQTVSFPNNGVWTGAYTTKVVAANVPAGATVKIQFDAGDSAINVDSITFGGGAQLTGQVEGEAGTMLGGAHTYSDSAASGSLGVGYISAIGDGLQFSNAAAASSMSVHYSAGAAGQLSLYINGIKNQTVSFPYTGGWTGTGFYSDIPITVTIPAGATVAFKNDGSPDAAANIDYVVLGGSTDIPLTNPGFETGNINGWTEWHPTGQAAKYGVDSAGVHSGTYKLYFWDTAAYQQSVTQHKTGLVNGSYTMRAWVQATVYGGAPSYCRMEADNFGGTNTYANMTLDGVWRQYAITVNVTNGTLDLAFYVNSPGSTSMAIDDVTLTMN